MTLPVVILAGGLATRLRPLTATIPKALIEVAGEPFAHHQLRLLARKGVTRVVYCVGYLGELIVDAVGDGRRFGLDVRYAGYLEYENAVWKAVRSKKAFLEEYPHTLLASRIDTLTRTLLGEEKGLFP